MKKIIVLFLDTNIISYYLIDNLTIIKKVDEILDNEKILCNTQINIYEILKGFRWKNNKIKENQFNELLKDMSVFSLDDNSIEL